MKTSNYGSEHPADIIRLRVAAGVSTAPNPAAVVQQFTNADIVDFAAGDVVVITSAGIIGTTTTGDKRPKGVVLDDIAVGDVGPVQTEGYTPYIHVTAAVTADNYAETSGVATEATESATLGPGSFALVLSSGTTPDGLLIGGSGGGGASSINGNDTTPPQSVPMPAWVKPSGSGVITADAQGKLTIDSGAAYKSFPGLAFLEGRLHLVYRSGTDHVSSHDGVVKYRYSDDLGRTWSSATTIVSAASTDMRDPSITALSSGRLLVGYDKVTSSGTVYEIDVIYSDNRGQSWSSPYAVPYTGLAFEVAGTNPMVELPDGTILLPAFGKALVGDKYKSLLFSSTDGGLTFGGQTDIATSGSHDLVEPMLVLMASGNLVCFMHDVSTTVYRAVSTDGGSTWGAAASVLTAIGRTSVVQFFPSALFLMGRDSVTNLYARWAVSWDEGATWTALQNVDGATDVFEYAAGVVLTPGYIAFAYAIQNSSTDTDLFLRYYHDGYGIDPLGNVWAAALSPGAAPTGAAGGDLSGTYPNPTVAKINGVAVTGTPSLGQVITATDATDATWQTPSTVGPQHVHVNNVTFNGDGATTVFELPAAPVDAYSIGVYIGTGRNSDWVLSGTLLTTLTFGAAPTTGTNNISVDIAAVLA